MLLSSYNNGDVLWYHVHDKGWVVPCPTLELVLALENIEQLKRKPTMFDVLRVCIPNIDEYSIVDTVELLDWFKSEVMVGLPLRYSDWLLFVCAVSKQRLDPISIDLWAKKPLLLLVSAFNTVISTYPKE